MAVIDSLRGVSHSTWVCKVRQEADHPIPGDRPDLL